MNHLQIIVVQTLSVQIDNGYLIQSNAYFFKVYIRSSWGKKIPFPLISCSLSHPIVSILDVEMKNKAN